MNQQTNQLLTEYTPDTVHKLLNFGAGFDWITPLLSLFGGARGRTERFKVPIEWFHFVGDTLGPADIKTRNEMFVGDDYVFDVAKQDAEQAAILLGLVRR